MSAAASVGVHLLRQTYQVHLACGLGVTGKEPVIVEQVDERVLLDRCAEVLASPATSLLPMTERLGTQDQLIVAVLGTLTRDDALQLARLRRRAVCVAIMVDAASWGGLSTRERAAADAATASSALLLHQSGWRVLRVDRSTSLETAWSGLNDIGALDIARATAGSVQ